MLPAEITFDSDPFMPVKIDPFYLKRAGLYAFCTTCTCIVIDVGHPGLGIETQRLVLFRAGIVALRVAALLAEQGVAPVETVESVAFKPFYRREGWCNRTPVGYRAGHQAPAAGGTLIPAQFDVAGQMESFFLYQMSLL